MEHIWDLGLEESVVLEQGSAAFQLLLNDGAALVVSVPLKFVTYTAIKIVFISELPGLTVAEKLSVKAQNFR